MGWGGNFSFKFKEVTPGCWTQKLFFFPPKSSHLFIGFSMKQTIHFGVPLHIFGNTHLDVGVSQIRTWSMLVGNCWIFLNAPRHGETHRFVHIFRYDFQKIWVTTSHQARLRSGNRLVNRLVDFQRWFIHGIWHDHIVSDWWATDATLPGTGIGMKYMKIGAGFRYPFWNTSPFSLVFFWLLGIETTNLDVMVKEMMFLQCSLFINPNLYTHPKENQRLRKKDLVQLCNDNVFETKSSIYPMDPFGTVNRTMEIMCFYAYIITYKYKLNVIEVFCSDSMVTLLKSGLESMKSQKLTQKVKPCAWKSNNRESEVIHSKACEIWINKYIYINIIYIFIITRQ